MQEMIERLAAMDCRSYSQCEDVYCFFCGTDQIMDVQRGPIENEYTWYFQHEPDCLFALARQHVGIENPFYQLLDHQVRKL